MSPIGFHSPIGSTVWEDLRGMVFLEKTHHWGWDLRVYIAPPHFQFTLSASCLWLRCDLSSFCSSSVPAVGCHASTMMHSCLFGAVNQNKFLPYIAFNFFYHSNGKIIITHLFFQLFVNPAYLNAKMPQVYGVIGDSPLTRSAGLRWDLGLSISYEFPGNPEAAGPQCTLWDTLLWADFSPPDFIFKFQPSHDSIKYHN